MASLKENIEQAISDFDGIKAALEENGVAVPYGTDTSEYGNLIRSLGAKVGKVIIDAVDPAYFAIDEEKTLRLLDIEMSKVKGLEEALKSIEIVNLIEIVKVGGKTLPINDKTVEIPIAANTVLGVVKSSEGENRVTVDENGEMFVSVVNINTLVQSKEDELILYGGSSFNIKI